MRLVANNLSCITILCSHCAFISIHDPNVQFKVYNAENVVKIVIRISVKQIIQMCCYSQKHMMQIN